MDAESDPLSMEPLARIRQTVEGCWHKGCLFHHLPLLPTPQVDFSLRGKAAGQARWSLVPAARKGSPHNPVHQLDHHRPHLSLRFNREAYDLAPDWVLQQTVPHEVAHLITRLRWGTSVRPHGPEWQSVMRDCFGLVPKRTHSIPLTAARRVAARFRYVCACREYQLTRIRHHRILRGQQGYACPHCRAPLRHSPTPADPTGHTLPAEGQWPPEYRR
jgi:SprT protein